MYNAEKDEESLINKQRRQLLAISESLNNPAPKLDNGEPLIKRQYTKRKHIEKRSDKIPETICTLDEGATRKAGSH